MDINPMARSSQAINSSLQVQRTAAKSPVAQSEKLSPPAIQQSSGKDSATFSAEALTRLAAEEEADHLHNSA